MADGEIRIAVPLDLSDAEKQLSKLEKKATNSAKAWDAHIIKLNTLEETQRRWTAEGGKSTAQMERMAERIAQAKDKAVVLENAFKDARESASSMSLAVKDMQFAQNERAAQALAEAAERQKVSLDEVIARENERLQAMQSTADSMSETTRLTEEQAQAADALNTSTAEIRKSWAEVAEEQAQATLEPYLLQLDLVKDSLNYVSSELKELAMSDEPPRGIVGWQKSAETSGREIDNLVEKLSALETKATFEISTDKIISRDTQAELDAAAQAIQNVGDKIEAVGVKAGITAGQMDAIPAAMDKTSESGSRQTSILRELASVAASVGSALRKAFSGAASAVGSFAKRLPIIGSLFKGIHRDARNATGGIERFGKRIFRLAAAALVFNQIRRAMRSLIDYYGTAMKQNDQLNAAFARLKGAALTAFQPLLEVAIPALTTLVNWLATAIQHLATFTSMLFNVDPTKMQANAKAMWDNVKATKAGTKEQRRFLATFDELITMSDEAAGAGADMGEIVPDFDFTPPPIAPWMEKLVDWFKPIIDSIKGAWDSLFKSITSAFNRWKNKLLTSWKKMTDSIKALIISIIDTFKRLFETDIWAAFLDEAFKLLRNIMDLITAVSDAFRKAWETDDKGLKMLESITRVYKEILGLINDIIEAFIEAWNENDIGEKIISNILGIITNIADTIANIVENIREAWNANGNGVAIWTSILNIIETITGAIESITAATAEWAGNLDFEPLISSIRTAFEALEPVITKITDALAWLYEEILLPFGTWIIEVAAPAIMDNLITPLANLASTILDVVVPAMKDLWENVLKPIASWIGETFLFVIEEIGNVFDTVTESLKENSGEIKTAIDSVSKIFGFLWTNAVKPSLENVKKLFGDVFKFIGDTVSNAIRTFSGLVDFIKGVFTGDMELAMTGLANLFGGILNSFLIGLETLINLAVSAINGLVSGLNTGVSALNQIPGVNIPQIPQIPRAQLPRIPKLARGGIVDSATLAMIGERGREAVVPLERNTGWMDALVDKLTEKNYATTYEAFLDALDASGRMDDIITAILRRREERPDNQRIARETLDINNGRSQRLGATV